MNSDRCPGHEGRKENRSGVSERRCCTEGQWAAHCEGGGQSSASEAKGRAEAGPSGAGETALVPSGQDQGVYCLDVSVCPWTPSHCHGHLTGAWTRATAVTSTVKGKQGSNRKPCWWPRWPSERMASEERRSEKARCCFSQGREAAGTPEPLTLLDGREMWHFLIVPLGAGSEVSPGNRISERQPGRTKHDVLSEGTTGIS